MRNTVPGGLSIGPDPHHPQSPSHVTFPRSGPLVRPGVQALCATTA